MEKKKLLLVAVSVGVFLVIVVSAAILIFKPSDDATSVASVSSNVGMNQTPGTQRSVTTNPAEIAANDAYRGIQNPAAISPIQENYINIYGDAGMKVDSKGDAATTTTTVINVPKPSTAAVPEPKPVVQAAPAPKPAAKPAPVAQPKPEAAPPAPKKSYRDFWVQAGSFSTRERADGVKSTLGTKGISAIVTNQDINGNMFYRVRLGPYTSQNEADYWLAMVKSIDGFQESQIWESQSFR
jgi:DedD protein